MPGSCFDWWQWVVYAQFYRAWVDLYIVDMFYPCHLLLIKIGWCDSGCCRLQSKSCDVFDDVVEEKVDNILTTWQQLLQSLEDSDWNHLVITVVVLGKFCFLKHSSTTTLHDIFHNFFLDSFPHKSLFSRDFIWPSLLIKMVELAAAAKKEKNGKGETTEVRFVRVWQICCTNRFGRRQDHHSLNNTYPGS